MPVDTTHVEYDEMFDSWQTMGDVLGGPKQIKRAGSRYLPFLAEQEDESWKRYRDRATFFNATGRTLEALMGFVFRKPPEIKHRETPIMSMFAKDATMTARSFPDVCKDAVERVLGKGRYGTLIEYDKDELRPYLIHYSAEEIINWRTRRINGKVVLSMVMLKENVSAYTDIGDGVGPGDRYQDLRFEQWRELELVPDYQGGWYVQVSIWRREAASQSEATPPQGSRLKGTGGARQVRGEMQFVKIGTYFPTRREEPLTAIPFVFHGPRGPKPAVERPPLEDMAEINISHYRTSADLENARHVLGMPTPCAAGFSDDQKDELYLGSSVAWQTSEPNAKAWFLALTGADIEPLENAITEKERQMAALGARMLDKQHTENGPEAFATVALRQSGEGAALTKIALAVSQSLTDVLTWVEWWQGTAATPEELSEKTFVRLNTDFIGSKIDSAATQSVLQLYLQNAISFETLFWNLQQGELIPPDVDLETERERLGKSAEMLLEMTGAKLEQEAAAAKKKTGEGGGGDDDE